MEIVKDVMSSTTDKLVIVSQWTSVLDVFARYLRKERICFVEFTGKTPIKIRNDIVVSFNKPNSRERVNRTFFVLRKTKFNFDLNNFFLDYAAIFGRWRCRP